MVSNFHLTTSTWPGFFHHHEIVILNADTCVVLDIRQINVASFLFSDIWAKVLKPPILKEEEIIKYNILFRV